MFVTALSAHTNQDRTVCTVHYTNIPPNVNPHTSCTMTDIQY